VTKPLLRQFGDNRFVFFEHFFDLHRIIRENFRRRINARQSRRR
jgi:hypothetical protein